MTAGNKTLIAFGSASLLIALAALALLAPSTVAAPAPQAAPTPPAIVQPAVVVPPGGEASLSFRSYCLDVHSPPPASSDLGAITGLADARVIKVLGKAIEQDLINAAELRDRFQPQYAIWRIDAAPESVFCLDYYTGKPIDEQAAADLLAFANSSEDAPTLPSQPLDAVPLHEAIAAGSLTIIGYDYSPVDSTLDPRLPSCYSELLTRGQPPDRRFAGQGAIRVRNAGDQPLTTYLAYGTVIEPLNFDPNDSLVQRLVAYAVGPAQPEPTATLTPEPTEVVTGTPSLEPTEIVTGTPSLEPTATITGTPVLEPTIPVTGTVPVEPTAGPVEPTATPAPGPEFPPPWCLPGGLIGLLCLGLIFLLLLILWLSRKGKKRPPDEPPQQPKPDEG